MTELREFDSGFFTLTDAAGITSLVLGREQLTEEENLEQLDRELTILMDTYHVRKIVLDLSTVSYLTSAGIGKLISLHRRLKRMNGHLVLCALRPAVEDILGRSQLLNYFRVAPDSDSARALLV